MRHWFGVAASMNLTLPGFIGRAAVVGAPIQHAWDQNTTYTFVGDERLAHRIAETSRRGVLAITVAFAEWVGWRLSPDADAGVLLNYVEASWAAVVDWRYLRPRHTVPGAPVYLRDWQGPVRGVVISTCNFLDEVFDGMKPGPPGALSASCLSELALYVMPDPTPYKDWRRFAIGRLATMYPPLPAGDLGPPIPREAMDPDVDYRPEMADELIRARLQHLDPGRNPFLRTPEEMIADGFAGTPYAF